MSTPHRAKITALGTYVPPRQLTNADLEKMVDTTDQWIVERTGIRKRHVVDKGVATSDLATCAAKRALTEFNVDPESIECIVVGTCTPDMLFPSTACLVQNKLGIGSGVWGFDVSAACSGFLYALTAGASMIAGGMHKKVLVIGADTNTCMVDYTDRAVCVIFGDGAGAVVLEPCADGEEGIIDSVHEIDGAGGEFLKRPGGGSALPGWSPECTPRDHYIHQDGQQVFKYAVRKMAEVSEQVLRRNGYSGADVGCFIPHQANLRIINASADRLKLTPEKVIVNIDEYGNTTAGTIPLAMQTARSQGRLKKGDLVVLAAVGGGFTSGATLLRWTI